jgi:signal transduction histidine kinase
MTDTDNAALDRLQRRANRERAARHEAEKLLENKSRELYLANQRLQEWSNTLEARVQKRTEELELQTRELQALISERERFTANVTHELRTPLQGILGFANLGINRGANASQEKIEKWFKAIHHSGDTLLQLVNNLLDIAKLDAGMMEIVIQHFTVEELFNDVYNEFTLRCKDKNVSLELSGDGQIVIDADQFRLGQVFRNLIGNALKFCNEATTITVQVSDTDTSIKIAVINKGPRIPDEEARSIFKAFVKSSSSRDNSGGTGLGLAICKHIISAHDGNIWLDTTHPDTCFMVELNKAHRAVA